MTGRQMSAEELRDNWPAVLLRPGRHTPATITVNGDPRAALLPYATAAQLAGERGAQLPEFTARDGLTLLLDLVQRAHALGCAAAITCRHQPAVALTPVAWGAELLSATEGKAQ